MTVDSVPAQPVFDWAEQDPNRWKELVGSRFFHETEGWLILVEVHPRILILKNSNGVLEQYVHKLFKEYIVEVEVDKGLGKTNYNEQKPEYEEHEKYLREFANKHDFALPGLLHAYGVDQKILSSVLKRFKANERPTREEFQWIGAHIGKNQISKFLSHSGLLPADGNVEILKVEGGVNHTGEIKVLYVEDYWPKRFRQNDKPSERILRFKEGGQSEVSYYLQKVAPHVERGAVLCCVPSSKKNCYGEGLEKLLAGLHKKVPCETPGRLICRTRTIVKRAWGGDRSIETNLSSMEIDADTKVSERDVVVVDDIFTTGNSLRASAQLLWRFGAGSVSCIAIGRTVNING
jgi:competence protein ComFC